MSPGLASRPSRLVGHRQPPWKPHYTPHSLVPKYFINEKNEGEDIQGKRWRLPRPSDAAFGMSPYPASPIAVFLFIYIRFYFLSPLWGAAPPKGTPCHQCRPPKGPAHLPPPLQAFFFPYPCPKMWRCKPACSFVSMPRGCGFH